MRVRRFVLMIVLLAFGSTGAAQVRPLPPAPNLSGSWTASTTERIAYSPFGAQFTVKQDASTVTFTTSRETITYTLDDKEHPRTTQTVRGDTWTRYSRARFVTTALLVTTRVDAGQTGHWEDLFIVSLDKPGEVTVVAMSAATMGGMSTNTFKYTKTQ